ncbi:MAG TPA: ABC transporter permease [Candidatus Kapabacteria bacterium]|jgi:phospholipid/cholesterol/gamma-HCH transport system permease protein|nr:ABC transporter permease [Candidatus Kapabacteria bacterium]
MQENSTEKKRIDIINDGGQITITPLAPITIYNANEIEKELSLGKLKEEVQKIRLDLSELSDYDSYLIILINEIKEFCSSKNIEFELTGLNTNLQNFINILLPKQKEVPTIERKSFWVAYFSNIGEIVRIIFSDLFKLVEFIGELTKNFFFALFKPSLIRWKDFPHHFLNAGVNAVPITSLIVFLIGLISGYQGAVQLSQFGADIYLADLVGISITRELSPLMVAIIVAGRSGSAFAAEIGTMKVSEEIDALTTMGFDKIQFLVLPRVIAVALAMPFLVIICDLVGIIGGLIAGLATLDITISSFFAQLNVALNYGHVFSGIIKSIVFGLLIATIGCFRGFQVQGGAESVGRYTTASVVSGVFLVILTDAVFVFLLSALGI